MTTKNSVELTWGEVVLYAFFSSLFLSLLLGLLFALSGSDAWHIVGEGTLANIGFLALIAFFIGLVFFTKEKLRFKNLTLDVKDGAFVFKHNKKVKDYPTDALTDIRLERQLYSLRGKAKLLIGFKMQGKRKRESFLVRKETIKAFALELFERKEENL